MLLFTDHVCVAEVNLLEERSVAQRALDMLAGVRVTGRTENEAALPLHTCLTAVGELTRTTSPVAGAMGSIYCQENEVLALQVGHFL